MRRQAASPEGRSRKTQIACAALAAATTGTGGVAMAGSGGIDAPPPPDVSDVVCIEGCAGVRTAAEGSRVELSGADLGAVETVSFRAADGRLRVAARNVTNRRVQARVPAGAVSGRPRVIDRYGARDGAPQTLEIVDEGRIPQSGSFKLASARARPAKAFFDGRRKPAVVYSFEGAEPTDVRIHVVDRRTRTTVASFRQRAREPFARHRAAWNGRLAGGKPAPNGPYRFRVGPAGGGAQTTDGSRFSLYGNKFPVRGPHSYGDGFGAGRGHQGQDVFAACGTRLVAARGGHVKFVEWHWAAGHYVVIDGRGTKKDYMYSHLASQALVRPGERVRTGQRLGKVGASGNAQGCHLHFELWRGPWQQGGTPLQSVTRALRNWDSWS